ncbi:hypothetical protein ABID81_002552 [Frigoribacterium sp. PvP054]|uniref:PD-(D/E)XK nuclease family protein n=1 Tax=Frigoribacterium sp. PvP054 TaxID=3156438 RepID=UPI0033989811
MTNSHRATDLAAALVGLIGGESALVLKEILDPVPNFWDVIDYGDAAGEIRYSKMIGWLLNPQENHGLGTSFAQSFVNAAYGGEAAPLISSRARVHPREWRSIDVLLVDHDEEGRPTLTLVVENKTGTIEHPRSGLGVGQTRWYNWVVRGDFPAIFSAIDASSLDPNEKNRVRRRARQWEAATGDYREVPDTGRHFVYLTPREGEAAEDPEFRTVTYAQLVDLLTKVEHTLVATGLGDAEKIVRDFRRAIHRRFERSLNRQINRLFGDDGFPTASSPDERNLAPELAGLASALGIIDEDHQRPGDEQYLAAARAVAGGVAATIAEVNALADQPVSEAQFGRLIEHIWNHRPPRSFNDTSKYFWGSDRVQSLTKIEVLQKIALAFAEQQRVRTVADFSRQFGEVVSRVVGTPTGNAFTGLDIVIDPDVYAYSPSAALRYREQQIALRDRIGALLLDNGRYWVSWQLGYRSSTQAGRKIHLPLIQHFAASGYPIVEAI